MSNSVIEVQQALDDAADMQFVRDKRKELINNILKEGVPKDIKEQSILLTALSDMDRSAIARLRIKSDDTNTDKMASAALVVAEVLRKTKPKEFQAHDIDDAREIPMLPASIPSGTYNEGLMQQGTNNTTFDEFMASRENK